ncbi:phage portal protein family protein [Acinetobacter guillouiae]|uniref:phage portal protein family protein n=1 Tax=Acinetobacter guillouiae TaxID=106649 RepID=UPI003CFEAACF
MTKSKKDKASKKALSYGNLYSQEAVTTFLVNFGRQPDTDEVLRKAGIQRHKLKIMLDDDEIAQTIETRLDALLAAPFRVEPNDTTEAELLNEIIKEWYFEIVSCGLNALFFGYSVLEAVYEVKPEGHIGLKWIGEKPMQWFEPKNDGRLIYRQEGLISEKEVDQTFKFFLTRRKASYEYPYGKALLATLYWLFFFKQNGFKFWAKFLERFGTPILLGKVKSKDTTTNDMNNALLNAHAQSVLSIDSQDDVQVLGTSGTSGSAGAAFESFNNQLIRQIQKVVLGQTLTSGNDGGGSRALGQVHENVRLDKLKSDMRLITPTLQAIVNALCKLNNWGTYEVTLGEKPKPLNKDQAERDAHLKNAGANLTPQYFQREYSLQDGDIGESVQASVKQFHALPKTSFNFKAHSQNLKPEQIELEEVAKNQPKVLLSESELEVIVSESADTNELVSKLYSATKGSSVDDFELTMSRALFMSDVMGYVHARQGK